MILFSQGPTHHSRLGNSIEWMSKFKFYLDSLNLNYYFPWAIENFSSYLRPDSGWMCFNQKIADLVFEKYNIVLTAKSVSDLSRSIEQKYEAENYLDAYAWHRLVCSDLKNNVLYLTGNVDITSTSIISAIKSHDLTICHEPFNFVFRNDFSLIGVDYSGLDPRSELYLEQYSYISEKSAQKVKVGLHVRRGDYISWHNGSYCYDDSYWLSNVRRFVDLGCSVWVFSNDLNTPLYEKFLELGANVSCSEYQVDFVRMMCMDKIYGPPSTFGVSALKIASEFFSSKGQFFYLPSK